MINWKDTEVTEVTPKWVEELIGCEKLGIPSSSPIIHFLQEGAILAGGAPREMVLHPLGFTGAMLSGGIRDFDLFFPSQEAALKAAWRVASTDLLAGTIVHQSEFALTFRDVTLQALGMYNEEYLYQKNVQVIWRCRFEGVIDLLEQFDFTATQFAMWMDEDGRIHRGYYDVALEDAKDRQLVYTGNTECPFSTLHRTQKYFQRGYTMKKRMLAGIVGDIIQKYVPLADGNGEGSYKSPEEIEQEMYDDTID